MGKNELRAQLKEEVQAWNDRHGMQNSNQLVLECKRMSRIYYVDLINFLDKVGLLQSSSVFRFSQVEFLELPGFELTPLWQ